MLKEARTEGRAGSRPWARAAAAAGEDASRRPWALRPAQPRSPAGTPEAQAPALPGGGGAREADWWWRPTRRRASCRACALSPESRGMADPEALGFEHMGLDPRLLQVPGGAERPGRRGWGWRRGGALSRASCLLGRRRPGLVTTHADPGEGHPAGAGGQGPAGSGPHGLGEDGRLCHSRAAAAAPQEGGGSRRRGGGTGAPAGLAPRRPARDAAVLSAPGWGSGRLAPVRRCCHPSWRLPERVPFSSCCKKRAGLPVLFVELT